MAVQDVQKGGHRSPLFFVLCILEGKLRSFLKADRVLEVIYERWADVVTPDTSESRSYPR